ncbi:MAG: phosphoribosyltransferase family protein [Longimicrobiales bacterium]|nr:phosphoribosyltransferase family protein [Longimicrobiales bacterium]
MRTPTFNLPGTNPRPTEFLDLSWEMFGELCRALALKVARDFHPDLVIGIARAGVIPGAVVASILRVDFHSLKISRKEGDEVVRDRPAILSAAPMQAAGKRVLLVDEIATSGQTLRMALAAVRDVRPAEVRTATSFARTRGYKPDYFALATDATIVYPWDRKVFVEGELVVNPRYQGMLDD